MPKAPIYRLLRCITIFCLCFHLFAPMIKHAWSQNETEIQTLIKKLKDPNADVRSYAAEAQVRIGPDAVPTLIETLKDESEDARRWVVWILGKVGSGAKAAVPDLIEALEYENEGIRRQAAGALKKIKTPEAMKALESYKKKSN